MNMPISIEHVCAFLRDHVDTSSAECGEAGKLERITRGD